ncbi:hypothetical protein Poly24_13210 [Rosistilla carotiformis]|uniref:J domain-containing protein n=1 Tax=Rosistilla carotiformis TaxID=2528017 RepID=A0A518JQ00_9BACT|nr:hypothetical protein [Rosistilla carotiformis]QDV67620.1 hypothetical protein Poly24_13210 [Rosistilla carotiformis]
MPDASEPIDPYHKWLGIPKSQQPPTHYRLLGIEPFEGNPEVIDAAASRQVAYLHQLTSGPHRRLTQKLMNEIAQARRVLMDDASREKYDAQLRERSGEKPASPKPKNKIDFGTFPAIDFGEKTPRKSANAGSVAVVRGPTGEEPAAIAAQSESPPPRRGRSKKAWWQKNDWRIHLGISAITVVIFVVYLLFWGPGSNERFVPEGNFEQPKIQNFDDKFTD